MMDRNIFSNLLALWLVVASPFMSVKMNKGITIIHIGIKRINKLVFIVPSNLLHRAIQKP
jgi:hypothetical protein